jgi:uncharacterized protein YndB with AHSA1/START domain
MRDVLALDHPRWLEGDRSVLQAVEEADPVPEQDGRHAHPDRIEHTGVQYPVRFEIIELMEPEMFLFESPPQPEFGFDERTTTRVVFKEDGGRTTVTITQGPHTGETIGDAQAGWTSILDTLDSLLAS